MQGGFTSKEISGRQHNFPSALHHSSEFSSSEHPQPRSWIGKSDNRDTLCQKLELQLCGEPYEVLCLPHHNQPGEGREGSLKQHLFLSRDEVRFLKRRS